jgi:tetratricopeptide (TPR) repeat protein
MIRNLTVLAVAGVLALTGCARNETIRTNVRKQLNDFIGLGNTDYKKGKFSTARIYYLQALDEAFSVDAVPETVYILQALADVAMRQDDLGQAATFLGRAVQLASDEKLTQYRFLLSLRSGKLLERSGGTDTNFLARAFAEYEKAAAAAKTDDERADVWQAMGVNLQKQKRYTEARELILKALTNNLAQNDFDSLGDNYFDLAEIALALGDPADALDLQMKSLQCDKTSENSEGITENLRRVGQIHEQLGDDVQALNYFYRSLSAANALGLDSNAKLLLPEIGKLSRKLGKPVLFSGNPPVATNAANRQKTSAAVDAASVTITNNSSAAEIGNAATNR